MRPLALACTGALTTLAAPLVLIAGVGVPAIRDGVYGLVALSAIGAGAACVGAARARSKLAIALAAVACLLAGLLALAVFVGAAVPKREHVPKAGDAAPPFTLLDTAGGRADLLALAAERPRLVVFFRGVW